MSFSIGQIANAVGIRASAIRYYEAEGLLTPPPRRGGRRVYDAADLELVTVLAAARRLGFSISDIRAFGPAPIGSVDKSARAPAMAVKLAQVDRRLAELTALRTRLALMRDCDCTSPSSCALIDTPA